MMVDKDGLNIRSRRVSINVLGPTEKILKVIRPTAYKEKMKSLETNKTIVYLGKEIKI